MTSPERACNLLRNMQNSIIQKPNAINEAKQVPSPVGTERKNGMSNGLENWGRLQQGEAVYTGH